MGGLSTRALLLVALTGLCPRDKSSGHAFVVRLPWHRPLHAATPLDVRVFCPAAVVMRMSKLVNVFDLGSMTVDQLRDALQRRGLPVSGKKADLLERLRADIRRSYDEEMAELGISSGPPAASSSTSLIPSKEEGEGGGLLGERLNLLDQMRARDRTRAAAAAAAADGGPKGQDMIVDSLPDYGKSPKHIIQERHVGWDGAVKGYTLADGTYVSVKEDPRLSEKELEKMDVELRKTVQRWEKEYPDSWAQFMAMCDEAEGREGRGGSTDEELEAMVKEVARLERERAAMRLPMARKIAEWEGRMALGKEVTVIEKKAAKVVVEEEDEEEEDDGVEVDDVGGGEEEEEEYVPIDAMYREELDFEAVDGAKVRGYLVSSKMAQKFWRREDRPVVLLLTDKCGWRNVQTRKLADHMALLTDHVFFVPDLYRDDPWVPGMGPGEEDEWRERHPKLRLLQDARSAMDALARNYNATAQAVMGFGVGGGQALSAVASGFISANVVVAICPHGYDPARVCEAMETPVFSVFGGQDQTAGGQLADAVEVMERLAQKQKLPYMLRIFKDEDGSFVLTPRQGYERSAEDALTLAVSWLEMQMRAGGRPRVIRDARVC